MSCNCVKSNSFVVGNIEVVNVSPQEVYDAVMMLKNNKACGMCYDGGVMTTELRIQMQALL